MKTVFGVSAALCAASACAQNGLIAVGSGEGETPQVRFYEPLTGQLVDSFLAFDAQNTAGVRVALGDVTGDGVADVIAGPGPSGLSYVRVFDGVTHAQIFESFPFDSRYGGGLFVAAGDVNSDGFDDIICAPGEFHPPEVVVYDGASLLLLGSFIADDPSHELGLHVASGDIDGDGDDDIITGRVFYPFGSGFGPNTRMTAHDNAAGGSLGAGVMYGDFVQSGVFVASGDFDNDGKDETLGGPDGAVGSLTYTFNDTSFFGAAMFFSIADPNFGGGVRVAAGDADGDGFDDLVIAAGPWTNPNIGPLINVYSGNGLALLNSFHAGDPMNASGIYVAGPWGTYCPADVNNDGVLSPADFNAWVIAFNTMGPGCDQNGDGVCDPSDFNAWVLNYNAGC